MCTSYFGGLGRLGGRWVGSWDVQGGSWESWRALGYLLGASSRALDCLEVVVEVSWVPLGACKGPLGDLGTVWGFSWAALGKLLGGLGGLLGRLVACKGTLEDSWVALGGLLGGSWGALGPSCGSRSMHDVFMNGHDRNLKKNVAKTLVFVRVCDVDAKNMMCF